MGDALTRAQVGDSDGMTYLFVFLFALSVWLGSQLYALDENEDMP